MLAAIESATQLGVEGHRVVVEVHVSNGLPGFAVVGLPDAACREARDRVRAALLSSGLPWPLRKVTVNLAPSGLRKAGSGFDLPIAVGLLTALGELSVEDVGQCGFVGELGLDGSIRPVPGTLPLAAAMRSWVIVVPPASLEEAQILGDRDVRTARSLRELVEVMQGRAPWPQVPAGDALRVRGPLDLLAAGGSRRGTYLSATSSLAGTLDLGDVRGQLLARRAVEVSAAGGHHLLLVGPPGAGKTMLAERLPGLLPALTDAEVLQTCQIHSAAGLPLPEAARSRRPPFRAPHHSSSAVSVIGGGTAWMRPGEVSLATNGVLFLDELGEFSPSVLETLRQPLEEGVVRVARARATVAFPASFLLVAAMNPCPCGGAGSRGGCTCAAHQIERYRRRLSAPLLDRFDLHVPVGRALSSDLLAREPGEPTAAVAERVRAARSIARTRGVACNAELAVQQLDELAPLDPAARRLLERQVESGELSGRGLARVRRVARTIGDLAGDEGPVSAECAATAVELRAGRRVLAGDSRWAA